jgi:hypothetical protein
MMEGQMTKQSVLSRPAVDDPSVRNGAATQMIPTKIDTEARSALGILCRPDIIQMQPNIFAAQFDLMKIVPARFILENALETGLLKEGGLVVESSSGTFALGLAIVCANLGLRLSLVTGQLEEALEWRLSDLCATKQNL